VIRAKLHKALLYEKGLHKLLMKLTPGAEQLVGDGEVTTK